MLQDLYARQYSIEPDHLPRAELTSSESMPAERPRDGAEAIKLLGVHDLEASLRHLLVQPSVRIPAEVAQKSQSLRWRAPNARQAPRSHSDRQVTAFDRSCAGLHHPFPDVRAHWSKRWYLDFLLSSVRNPPAGTDLPGQRRSTVWRRPGRAISLQPQCLELLISDQNERVWLE